MDHLVYPILLSIVCFTVISVVFRFNFYYKICYVLCNKLSVIRKERCLISQCHGYIPMEKNQKHSVYGSIGTSAGETRLRQQDALKWHGAAFV